MDDEEIAELLRAEITDEQAIFSDEGGDSGAEDDLPLQVDSASVSSTRSDNSYSHNIDSSTSPLTPKQDDLSTSLLSDEDLMSAPPTSNADPILLLPTTSKADFSVLNLRPRKPRLVLDFEETENLFSDNTDEDPSYSPPPTASISGLNKEEINADLPQANIKQSCTGLLLNVPSRPTTKKCSVLGKPSQKQKQKEGNK
ncbi:uncharacterized protein LOC124369312 [Homalodisca vitripennis]|uniref:uncharacterized protein LOC124369312 n=1 Tax=Homalodisca vitripennis TaxID=197043 RepID=UPI001EEBCF2D|nr:uncharacterized protein LOC124369312 [Homalodisca vitripennis]KAG8256871.1 hypothetical protein J6590_061154 [Homalodisca vitripennis]